MKLRLTAVPFALGVLALAVTFMLRDQWPWARLSDVPVTLPIVVSSSFRVVSDTLKGGETVSQLLQREGVKGLDLVGLANTLRFDPRRIKAGLIFSVHKDASTDEPTNIEFRSSAEQRLRFIRTAAGGWTGEAVQIHWTTDTIRIEATIDSSTSSVSEAFDRDPSAALLDHDARMFLVYALADVNAYSVDFSRDIQRGDRFITVVERKISEDGEVRLGNLLANEGHVGGKTIRAFRYDVQGGESSYYDDNGTSIKRAFLLAPVDFRYISSQFARSRFHPILGLWRKHEGTDYAAERGTPVHASGNGVIAFAGWAGGYGNMVEIKHSNGITTRYGHLRKIESGIRPGVRVSQGQKVGEVGMTGLATGPHLHYEFRVDGIARDPRSVKSGTGSPLPDSQLDAFQRQRSSLIELLDRRVLASNAVSE